MWYRLPQISMYMALVTHSLYAESILNPAGQSVKRCVSLSPHTHHSLWGAGRTPTSPPPPSGTGMQWWYTTPLHALWTGIARLWPTAVRQLCRIGTFAVCEDRQLAVRGGARGITHYRTASRHARFDSALRPQRASRLLPADAVGSGRDENKAVSLVVACPHILIHHSCRTTCHCRCQCVCVQLLPV